VELTIPLPFAQKENQIAQLMTAAQPLLQALQEISRQTK
jgi:hypothetical protein